ncbi:MAG: hydrogenase formation protein HypD, partial [Pseudomonadales bacterium]
MKYVDEFRDAAAVRHAVDAINGVATKPWNIMEICGGQTHSIMRYGLHELLPRNIHLLHGPGCPVCVTPAEKIDQAVAIAMQENTVLCSYGDMLRVPGSGQSLLDCKALGADVRIIYSPLEAVDIAMSEPAKQVVLFAIGFETTAPGNAAAIKQAKLKNVENFSALVCQVTVPAAIDALLGNKDFEIDGFLAAGHVCTIMGFHQYHQLAKKYRVPIVITGFEPLDILAGIEKCVLQLESGRHRVENAYARYVTEQGNQAAQALLQEVFQQVDQTWRGIGVMPDSGLCLNENYRHLDAEQRFLAVLDNLDLSTSRQGQAACQSGLVLQGKIKPDQCPLFGKQCRPDKPLGATMVSSEGACAA